MSNQNLIIYKFTLLYQIIDELGLDLNFKVIYIDSEKLLKNKIKSSKNYLIISNKEYLNISNQIIINRTPINILKLVEKINIGFLKLQFNNQSHLKINDYNIDLNSRLMSFNSIELKLTEKEINTIIYLSKVNNPVNIEELQQNVWSYQSDIETHTVETHIYRLRKKISKSFDDNEFIISKKNGYQIK